MPGIAIPSGGSVRPASSARTALIVMLTGWWRANGCSQPGIVATGTIADAGEHEHEEREDAGDLGGFRVLCDQADRGVDPGEAVAEEDHERQPGDDRADAGVEAEADEQTQADHQREREHAAAEVGERAAGEDGRAGHRQAAEAVDDAAAQVVARVRSRSPCRRS